ncbi:MAG: TolC family protein [Chitinophagaceae bacterium]|nr:TolC family protein [Chitinophagaceae bacterium]
MKNLFFYSLFFITTTLLGQDKKVWSLEACVQYAIQNNVSVKQADVAARLSQLDVDRAIYLTHPNVSFNTNVGGLFGRSVDPTTNQFVSSQLVNNNYNVNAGIQLYNWGSLKLNKEIATFNAKASLIDIERITNDVSLNIATFYLQVLSAKQQLKISSIQIDQTQSQLNFTRLRVNAGSLPELNAAELEAQLARDSASYISSNANYALALIQLKAAINLDMASDFEVETPPVESIKLEPLMSLEPESLYKFAVANQPLQRANELRLKSSLQSIQFAKTAFYPTISLYAGLNSRFANTSIRNDGLVYKGDVQTSFYTQTGTTKNYVFQPDYEFQSSKRNFFQMWEGWGNQLDQNFSQNFGIQIQVPILNNGSSRLGYERAKLNYRNSEFTNEQANITLKQNIYQAFQNASAALQRFNISKKSVDLAAVAYEFSKKRYEAGLGTTLDLLTNQNNYNRAQLDKLNNQFEYIFRMKILEFYKGQGIKL